MIKKPYNRSTKRRKDNAPINRKNELNLGILCLKIIVSALFTLIIEPTIRRLANGCAISVFSVRPLSHLKLISKLISKFMFLSKENFLVPQNMATSH